MLDVEGAWAEGGADALGETGVVGWVVGGGRKDE